MCVSASVRLGVCAEQIFGLRQIDTHELIKRWFVISCKCIRLHIRIHIRNQIRTLSQAESEEQQQPQI